MTAVPDITKFCKRAADLEAELANPAVYADQRRVGELARELQRLKKLMADHDRWHVVQQQIAENDQLVAGTDPELADLAKTEIATLRTEADKLAQAIQVGILPPERLAQYHCRNPRRDRRRRSGVVCCRPVPDVLPVCRFARVEN